MLLTNITPIAQENFKKSLKEKQKTSSFSNFTKQLPNWSYSISILPYTATLKMKLNFFTQLVHSFIQLTVTHHYPQVNI